MSTTLIDYALRSSAILLAGLAALTALRRSSASLRHAVLCTALAAAALVAPLGHAAPWPIPVPLAAGPAVVAPLSVTAGVDAGPTAAAAGRAAPRQRSDGLAATTWVVATWIAGFLLLSVHRVRALADLGRAASTARPLDDASWTAIADEMARAQAFVRPVRLLVTDRPGLLATWGVFAPRLAVPAHALRWDAAKVRAVLAHEFEHVRRRDWIVQLAADLVRDANWWNPLFWWASRRLRLESERACDDAVLRSGMAGVDYALHLVDIARACGPATRWNRPAVAMARRSTLRRRIDAMLNPRLSRTVLSLPLALLVVVAVFAAALPVAGLRADDGAARTLAGVLYDPDGAVLPDVPVTLDPEGGSPSTVRTDASGRFTFAAVPAGRHAVRVSRPAFKALTRTVELREAKDWTVALVLQVGDVQETITIHAARTGKAPAAAQPAKVRVGGTIQPPTKVKDVHPAYPQAMREAGEEGTVLLDTVIARDGSVQSIRVVPSPVHQALVDAAIAAVGQWRFTPTLLNGTPVEVVMRVSLDFALEGE
jgi:TonB family protein